MTETAENGREPESLNAMDLWTAQRPGGLRVAGRPARDSAGFVPS
jgi:hypothetical protein